MEDINNEIHNLLIEISNKNETNKRLTHSVILEKNPEEFFRVYFSNTNYPEKLNKDVTSYNGRAVVYSTIFEPYSG